jgi:hypothetical protein
MRRITAPLLFVLLLTGLYFTAPCLADDLNDGIEADDGVQQYNELGSSTKNFSYLTQRAKSKARSKSGDVVLSDKGALNSVVLDAGASIHGDIIIIDDSKGDKTVISH